MHYIVRLLEGIGVPTPPSWISAIPIPSLPFLSLSFTAPLILFGLAAVLCCVEFQEGELGLSFDTTIKHDVACGVEIASIVPSSQADLGKYGNINIGDQLNRVNGQNVRGIIFKNHSTCPPTQRYN